MFIRSSVDGHLGCFRALAIVNSAAMNNGVRVSFSNMVSLGYLPSSEIVESYGTFPSFFFKGISILEPTILMTTQIFPGKIAQNSSPCKFQAGTL